MKLKNLSISSTKAFALVQDSQSVTEFLQAGWDVRFDHLLVPPLTDPTIVNIPGFTSLVSNGSLSTVKWPVTGAFSKWNILEGPYQPVNVDLFDIFRKSLETDCGEGDYSPAQPALTAGDLLLFQRGLYDPVERKGIVWYNEFSILHYANECNHVASPDVNLSVIRECPSFSLPQRIQLRISLVRVKEN